MEDLKKALPLVVRKQLRKEARIDARVLYKGEATKEQTQEIFVAKVKEEIEFVLDSEPAHCTYLQDRTIGQIHG